MGREIERKHLKCNLYRAKGITQNVNKGIIQNEYYIYEF